MTQTNKRGAAERRQISARVAVRANKSDARLLARAPAAPKSCDQNGAIVRAQMHASQRTSAAAAAADERFVRTDARAQSIAIVMMPISRRQLYARV